MALIAGASQFVNTAALANRQGIAPTSNNILSSGGSTTDLLEAGRSFGARGIGLSARARASTKQFLDNTAGLGNALLSVTAEANSTDSLKTQILAIRSSLSENQLSRGLTGGEVSAETQSDNPFLEITKGNTVDTSA